MSGSLKKPYMKYKCGESICQQKRENNKSIYKISKFRNCWLTVLTSDFSKPKLQTVRIVHQNLTKLHNFRTQKIFSNSWTQKISEVFQTQKISELFGLRKILHHRTQKFFNIGKIWKKLRKISSSQNLESFHDNS